jgi:hypothetical protein
MNMKMLFTVEDNIKKIQKKFSRANIATRY